MNKAKWTGFWKRYNVIIYNKKKFLKEFSADNLCKKLIKAGIEDKDISTVKKKFNDLSTSFDKEQFNRLVSFFLFNTPAVTKYLKSRSTSKAYVKLARLIAKNDIEDLKNKFDEIHTIYQWEQKPRGALYTCKIVKKINFSDIKSSDFTRYLSRSGLYGKYIPKRSFFYSKVYVIPFVRKQIPYDTYKIIALEKKGRKINILIPSHSEREDYIIKSVLSSKIGSFPDVLETEGSFRLLLNFVKKGYSQHFTLNRITFKKEDHFITAFSTSKKPLSINECGIYDNSKNKLDIESVSDMKLRNRELKGKDTFFVGVRSFNNGDLLGSISLDFAESKLSDNQIKQIKDDFKSDFSLDLKTFISHGDYTDEDICRIFLDSNGRKVNVRYPKAWAIYNDIRKYGLLAKQEKSKDKKYYCFNPHCRLKYVTQWKKYCEGCKSLLYPGKVINVSTIKEEQIISFLIKVFTNNGISYEKFDKVILKKKYSFVQIRLKKDSTVFMPISRKKISDNFLDVASLKFPNTVIIYTGVEGHKFEQEYNIKSIPLYEIFYNIIARKSLSYLSKIANQLTENRVNHIRALSKRVERRITNKNFYINNNKRQKNFGAELFEADCSVLLNYIFSNSLWLGTSKRGKALPDGISAFPLIPGKKGGCFIWDAKFSEKGRLSLGSISKNRKYVIDATSNRSVKQHGGLKSFVIIGNQKAPNNFKRNFKKVTKNRRSFKTTFISNKQLLRIYRYFKKHEKEILSNDLVRNTFLELFKQLFFKHKRIVAESLNDSKIKTVMKENRRKINQLKSSLNI